MAPSVKTSPKIPREVIDYILYGGDRNGATKSRLFARGGSVVAEIWYCFAEDQYQKIPVLVAPSPNVDSFRLAHLLHNAIMERRKRAESKECLPGIAPLESYILLTIGLDDLFEVLLPLTSWWVDLKIDDLAIKAHSGKRLVPEIIAAVKVFLQSGGEDQRIGGQVRAGLAEAAPIITLAGLYQAAVDGKLEKILNTERGGAPLEPAEIKRSLSRPKAIEIITSLAAGKFRNSPPKVVERHIVTRYKAARDQGPIKPDGSWNRTVPESGLPPCLIQRIFRDRDATLAVTEAKTTIKADAATRLFNVDCSRISWAVIDSGVDVMHDAFRLGPTTGNAEDDSRRPSRFRAVYDFSEVHQLLSLDLIEDEGRAEAAKTFAPIEMLRTGKTLAEAKNAVTQQLNRIAEFLRGDLKPDWKLIDGLVSLNPEAAPVPVSNHGTHVAGIIGADLPDRDIKGVCPTINLYDFRVLPGGLPVAALARGGTPETSVATTREVAKIAEFAVIAVLEFIQYLNARQMQSGLVIHGVNISLSIPHDVRNYGCGATPVCVACDKLVGAGVTVIAAAGNFGWQERDTGFGQFIPSSITDPGNAREVITVGSTHKERPHTYGVSFFSGRGPTGDGRMKPDVVAPGEKIMSTVPGGAAVLTGTSMASPLVSGAAALLMARHRELIGNPRRVKEILCRSATDLERERHFQGHGLVDALRALQMV